MTPTDPLNDLAKYQRAEEGSRLDNVLFGTLEALAESKNGSAIQDSLLANALQGKGPRQVFGEMFDFEAEQERIRQEIEAKQQARLQSERQNPDESTLDQKWNKYAAAVHRAPEAAPILAKAKIGDPEAIIGLATVLLGGLGVAPTVLQGLTLGAQRVADQENADRHREFQDRQRARDQETEGLKMDYLKEREDWKQADKKLGEEFQRKDRDLLGQIAVLQGKGKHVAAVDKALNAALADAFQQFQRSTDWNENADQWLHRKAAKLAEDYALKDEDPAQQTEAIFNWLRHHADKRIQSLKQQEQATKAKQDEAERNANTKFVFRPKLSPDFFGWTDQEKAQALRKELEIQMNEFELKYHHRPKKEEQKFLLEQAWRDAHKPSPLSAEAPHIQQNVTTNESARRRKSPTTKPPSASKKPRNQALPGKLTDSDQLPPADPGQFQIGKAQ